MHAPLKRYHAHLGRDIFITSGSARDLAPGSFGILAIGGGAEGWSVVHVGPDGHAADLGGEYFFATAEEALAFTKELIEMLSGGAEPSEG